MSVGGPYEYNFQHTQSSLWGDTGGEEKKGEELRSNHKFPLIKLTSFNNVLPDRSLMQINLS